MVWKIVISLCALTFGLVVPVLEVNATHVFNPAWPAHARLHEVWQLITNCILAGACLWLAWARGRIAAAAMLALAVIGGFLAAYAVRGVYGGSMVHPNGSELLIGGVNPATAIMLAAAVALLGCLWSRARSITRQASGFDKY